jgi:uncharacterized protein with PQ loop repeat
MSWPRLVLTLSFGLLASRSSAVTTRSSLSHVVTEWWRPVAGVLRVYQVSDELFEGLPGEMAPRRHPPLSFLEELGEEAVTTQEQINNDAESHGHQGAIGAGAGAGKTAAQITFAGATNAAANKVAASVASSNALSVASSNTVVTNLDAKGKVLTATAKAEIHPLAALGWMAWLRVTLSTGFMVKTMCMMCNIFYQASPLPLITEYRFKGDTGDADLAPFIATAYGGWQWCFYGLFAYIVTGKSGFLVLVYSNVVGATLGLYYVYSFNLNCKDKHMIEKRQIYYYVLMSIVSIQFVAIMSLEPVRALFFCGLISSAWSTIASASLVATVPKVLETRSSKSLPLPLLVMGSISALLWIICGVMLWDPWITFPNLFALVVCIGALYLCHIFPADGSCEDYIDDADSCAGDDAKALPSDVERASPLQRAFGGLVGRSALSGDAKDTAGSYGGLGGTGGTGDSF